MENTNRKEELLNNWPQELTDIIWSSGADLNILNRDLKVFIEELLEAKEDADYWQFIG